MPRSIATYATLIIALGSWQAAADDLIQPRLRVIVETDAGGDPDDEQSLVRFLLYTNEWDVEGIIANREQARDGENLNPERTGLGIVQRLVRAYGDCYPQLRHHDPRYPAPDELAQRTVAGYEDRREGVDLILRAVDADDPRPVWFLNWGTIDGCATSCLRRALDQVLEERGPDGYAKFKSRLRLSSDDQFDRHTTALDPPFPLWVDTFRPPQDRLRWYHRFSAITATAGDFDLHRDVLSGHGPLGMLYPTNTTHAQKEGDTMTFLYLVPTGMNDPEQPGWGSWAGRYSPRTDDAGQPGRNYLWAAAADHWQGKMHRDQSLARWAADLQNDFRARLDWCVRSLADANHPPRVVVNRVGGDAPLQLAPRVGTELVLDASASADPDGDDLDYRWIAYPEAGAFGSHDERLEPKITLVVPASAAGQEWHWIVAVTDRGEPPLTRYRRVVITATDPRADATNLAAFSAPPREWEAQRGEYRSPLLFHDGSRAGSSDDWPRRRAEILDYWQEVLGPWPPVIDRPRMDVVQEFRRDHFRQQRVQLEIGPNQTGAGWLLIPDTPGPKPAVLVVYYEPETSVGLNRNQPDRDFGLQLARRGFVTLSIGSPGGDAWHPDTAGASCQPLSYHAYVAANAWQALAQLPDVDSRRIGVVGHSYGGKWALFAAALWEKFACVAVSDPGIVFDESRSNVNYWEPWYLGWDRQVTRKAGIPTADNPRTGAYRRLIEEHHDLHEVHALLAPRPFFVSGGSEDPVDRWTALNHLVDVQRLWGGESRVFLSNRADHNPNAESNRHLYAFFVHFLHSEAKP